MPPNPSQLSKPQRTLACVRCQQRKTRCDRRFPCANCNAASVSCVPATLTTRRRRRFPERELLERLRRYEDLLRQHQINFEPLHPDSTENREKDGSDDEQAEATRMDGSSASTTFRESQEQLEQDSDSSLGEARKVVVRTAWAKMYGDNDHLLFGTPEANVDLSTLHPQPVQIFRFWQLYLDNVNPLLKVTHTPTLQSRIIDAASHVSDIEPSLEALMFSIYCMALVSLDDGADNCLLSFGSSKEDLLTRFQFGCRQALQNCGFLRTNDRDCLTALCLYLISVRPNTVPQSLSAMLGVAIRIAQRMGINSESTLAKCSVLDAELRRRLWWALVLFDTRISELADYKTETLAPTWDCRLPLNLNDSDLRPEMKEPPEAQKKPTDSIFLVVRSELAEFVRSSMSHLDFATLATKPALTAPINHPSQERPDIGRIEKLIEDKYLRFCNAEDHPVHFMTIWWTREFIARCRLVEFHSRLSNSSVSQTDAHRDTAMSLALEMLECDTHFLTSPHVKEFLWLIYYHRSLPAFLQVIQDLKRRPTSKHAERAWDISSKNQEARSRFSCTDGNPFFKVFANLVLQAWEARQAVFGLIGERSVPPTIVTFSQQKLIDMEQKAEPNHMKPPINLMDLSLGNSTVSSMARNLDNQGSVYNGRGPLAPEYDNILLGEYPNMLGDTLWDVDLNAIDWNADIGFQSFSAG